MKTAVLALLLVTTAGAASAQGLYGSPNPGLSGTGSNPSNHYVAPHVTRQGTYVQPYYQTNPNNTQRDNYGTKPNVNPYTGAIGTRSADR